MSDQAGPSQGLCSTPIQRGQGSLNFTWKPSLLALPGLLVSPKSLCEPQALAGGMPLDGPGPLCLGWLMSSLLFFLQPHILDHPKSSSLVLPTGKCVSRPLGHSISGFLGGCVRALATGAGWLLGCPAPASYPWPWCYSSPQAPSSFCETSPINNKVPRPVLLGKGQTPGPLGGDLWEQAAPLPAAFPRAGRGLAGGRGEVGRRGFQRGTSGGRTLRECPGSRWHLELGMAWSRRPLSPFPCLGPALADGLVGAGPVWMLDRLEVGACSFRKGVGAGGSG